MVSNLSSLAISDDRDEYPEVTQANLDQAVFRVGLRPSPRKQSITVDLDENLIAYFKLKAGEEGYQALIIAVFTEVRSVFDAEMPTCQGSCCTSLD